MWLAGTALPPLSAQGTQAQYDWVQRASRELNGKVLNERLNIEWSGDDEQRLWFREQTSLQTHRFVLVDTTTGERSVAFDHDRLAKQLAEATKKPVDAERLPIRKWTFSDDAQQVRFAFDGRNWEFDRTSLTLKPSEENLAAQGLPALRWLRPSRSGGESSGIVFVNERADPVVLYWLDPQGNRQRYSEVAPGTSFDQHTFEKHVWLVTDRDANPLAAVEAVAQPSTFTVTENATPPSLRRRGDRGRARRETPDADPATMLAKVQFKNDNVVLQRRETPTSDWTELPLTTDGTSEDGYGGRVFWSPDQAYFVVLRTKRASQREVTVVDTAPDDQLQPRTLQFGYAKPGDELDHPRPYLGNVQDGTLVAIDDSLFDNPFSVNDYQWKPDSSAFRFVYNQRGHQRLSVIEIDPQTATPRVLVENRSETFIDYAHKQYLRFLDDTDEVIWMSQRDGWNHLYLIDQKTGQTIRPLTSGEWVVRGVESFDEQARTMLVSVGGYYPEQDPYQRHLLRVSLDDGSITPLTAGDGDHQWSFSPRGGLLIDRYSRVDMPPVTELRRVSDGSLVCTLAAADWAPLLEQGWRSPERFVAKGRDGKTDIYGIIIRPHDFDPEKKYPVLEAIYAGPHSAFVPKSFGLQRGYADLADLGFVVVKIDGMGTSHRSQAFHDVCWKNLADSGFPDRILWMQAAAKQVPQMDLSRVGIWGGSAGGQSALGALLNFGDFYHAAVADCGCHDNRMDKIWWNELWMGWPIGPHYEEQSNVTNAHRLKGDLLLTVGEVDHNVDPASTMQVVDALINADKDFELIVFPGRDHGAGESAYGKRRRSDFFVRKLWDREPRSETNE